MEEGCGLYRSCDVSMVLSNGEVAMARRIGLREGGKRGSEVWCYTVRIDKMKVWNQKGDTKPCSSSFCLIVRKSGECSVCLSFGTASAHDPA